VLTVLQVQTVLQAQVVTGTQVHTVLQVQAALVVTPTAELGVGATAPSGSSSCSARGGFM
jgi:hypothetical protein